MIHLDTSFLIRALVPGSREDGRLRSWLADAQPLGISAIAWTEFLCGPLDSHAVELALRVVGEQVPFTSEDAGVAARLFNVSGKRRGTLIDCMVAASCIRGSAELATANPADFKRFEQAGLRVVTS
ncbi:MAG TPA: type II toxin-antitoxin system VapC family toxin [Gemmatimonadales bacterium]|nr:type II toxin-antitoxin system VapC family toxin [Gemmatimonadales bacterium]